MWDSYKKGFIMHLTLEKSLSENTVEAYTLDLDKLIQYVAIHKIEGGPKNIKLTDLQSYLKWIAEIGMSERSQARILSGIKSFYRYCIQEQVCTEDPTELLSAPKQKKVLPDTLTFEEIEKVISSIDQSSAQSAILIF